MFSRSSAGWRKLPRPTSVNVMLLYNWPKAMQKGEAWAVECVSDLYCLQSASTWDAPHPSSSALWIMSV